MPSANDPNDHAARRSAGASGMGPQPHPGHDAERALGAEEQLGEVGADGGGRRAAGAHDVAARP